MTKTTHGAPMIVFGAGEMGRSIVKQFSSSESNVVFYDNDRRLWGKAIDGVYCIDFLNFLRLVNYTDRKIIVGTDDKKELTFLKDVCENLYGIYQVEMEIL